MKIISEREHHEETSYVLHFRYIDDPGAGFGFDCDKDGNVDVAALNECAKKSYETCLAGEQWRMVGVYYDIDRNANDDDDRYVPIYCTGTWVLEKIGKGFVEEDIHRWTSPAIGECDCGAEVSLGNFTNTCDQCGADFSMSGQRLAPRSQWCEETYPETADDVLRGGDMFDGDY